MRYCAWAVVCRNCLLLVQKIKIICFYVKNALPLLFIPPVLRIPTGLCILDDLKYLSLVEIGTIFF